MSSKLPSNLFLPAFSHGRLGFLFSAIMMIMIYLATLATGLQVALPATGLMWQRNNDYRLTIEIPSNVSAVAENIVKIKELTQSVTGVVTITAVSEQEVIRLLQPWIKDEAVIKNLPLPTLLDIDTNDQLDEKALNQKLKEFSSDIQIQGHADWFSKVQRIVSALALAGWLLLGTTITALLSSVFLVCKAAMAVEEKTISLLHIMGAKDKSIAQAFASQIRRISVQASLWGFSFAVLTLALIGALLQPLSISWNSGAWPWVPFVCALVAVPLCAIPGASIAARLSVHAFLKRLI